MGKTKIFLDFDNTITNSTLSFCQTYNHLYKYQKDFINAQWDKVEKYNFSCQCSLLKSQQEVLEIFENPIFFKKLKFINLNTYEVLRKLNEKYHIIIVSIGTPLNLARKAEWLQENIPFIKDYVLLNNGNCEMNKAIVNMKQYLGSIHIDDVTSNLDSSDAWNKIIFGKVYEWSETKDYKRYFDWTEVEKELL